MFQVKEKVSLKVLKLGRVWLLLGIKEKYEWCEMLVEDRFFRVGFLGYGKEFVFYFECSGGLLEDFKEECN